MFIKEKLNKFFELVNNQFTYGGKKYNADNSEKEATDILCERHGYRGLFWTMNKYIFRYRNFHQEKELLKIATYCYLLYLKRGFFVLKEGIDSPIIYTNTDMKIDNFDKFKEYITNENKKMIQSLGIARDEENIESSLLYGIEDSLRDWSKSKIEWKDISLRSIDSVFINCFYIWQKKFGENKSHSEDINNEKNQK